MGAFLLFISLFVLPPLSFVVIMNKVTSLAMAYCLTVHRLSV